MKVWNFGRRGVGRALPGRCLAWVVGVAMVSAVGCDTPVVGAADVADTTRPGADADNSPADLDWRELSCDSAPRPFLAGAACVAAEPRHEDDISARHVAEDTPISYATTPPLAGDHRGQWAKWGAYTYLPAQRYLHNLEHGGVAVLYNPCLDADSVDALRTWLADKPADDTGAFRWVLTPFEGLSTDIAVVAWEEGLFLSCWTEADIAAADAFIETHYRTATEDLPFDGSYTKGWLGR